MDRNADILVIGGGMAGLAAARALHEGGARVIVIDKGRGPGGRMATRRVEVAGHQVSFDHGAQYFTARDPAFRAVVAGWEAAGVAARWPAAYPLRFLFASKPEAIGPVLGIVHRVIAGWLADQAGVPRNTAQCGSADKAAKRFSSRLVDSATECGTLV